MGEYFRAESLEGRKPVFLRFFVSDAQNQAAALQAALDGWTAASGCSPAVSVVEQPPLDGSRITVLAQTATEEPAVLFHSLRLTEEEAAGRDSYAQSRLLFDKYLDIIRPLGLELKTHCVRTWIFVRDIDANYAGLVKARNDVFAEEGLSFDTHYIASTGIGGATEERLTELGIRTLGELARQDPKEMEAKVKSMFTDPGHLRVEDPGKVEGNTVFTYLDAFCEDSDFAKYWPEYQNLQEVKDHYTRGGLGDMKCKKFLIKVLHDRLEPIRARRHEYEQDIPEVYNILKKGSEAAREVAAQTLHEMKDAMKINYFDDAALIAEQAAKYRQ